MTLTIIRISRKRLKTRSGKTVRLLDLLDEGMERALLRLMEKKRDQVSFIRKINIFTE